MSVRAGRTCVVTGATSGIGERLALALAERGDLVWALGRSTERLARLASSAEDLAGRVVPVEADFESEDQIAAACERILAQTEQIDVLAHSAGAMALGSFESIEPSTLDELYRVNLRAPFLLTRRLLAALKAARGQIVFVNSSAGLRASAENALYAATKHGLRALADGLRDEVNPDGVRVISVYPGRTATPMQRSVHDYEGRDYDSELLLQPEDVVDVVFAALDHPETGEVTDVSVRPMRKLSPR
jgi:NADP-dependent 3-hydroxy acid dehydrogenase YdfG